MRASWSHLRYVRGVYSARWPCARSPPRCTSQTAADILDAGLDPAAGIVVVIRLHEKSALIDRGRMGRGRQPQTLVRMGLLRAHSMVRMYEWKWHLGGRRHKAGVCPNSA